MIFSSSVILNRQLVAEFFSVEFNMFVFADIGNATHWLSSLLIVSAYWCIVKKLAGECFKVAF